MKYGIVEVIDKKLTILASRNSRQEVYDLLTNEFNDKEYFVVMFDWCDTRNWNKQFPKTKRMEE